MGLLQFTPTENVLEKSHLKVSRRGHEQSLMLLFLCLFLKTYGIIKDFPLLLTTFPFFLMFLQREF